MSNPWALRAETHLPVGDYALYFIREAPMEGTGTEPQYHGKVFQFKRIFVRDKMKVVRLYREMKELKNEDDQVDKLIEILAVTTTIDKGDLNAAEGLDELMAVLHSAPEKTGDDEKKVEPPQAAEPSL
jgi:hypothetical protein